MFTPIIALSPIFNNMYYYRYIIHWRAGCELKSPWYLSCHDLQPAATTVPGPQQTLHKWLLTKQMRVKSTGLDTERWGLYSGSVLNLDPGQTLCFPGLLMHKMKGLNLEMPHGLSQLLLTCHCQLKKKKHNLKVENYVLFDGQNWELKPTGCSLSDSSEGLLQRGKGGARIFRSFCNKD